MRKLIALAGILTALLLASAASAQVLTGGQVLTTNALTYIPATNGTQSALLTVTVPQTTAQIGNLNFSATNQLNGTAYLSYNGVIIAQLIQKWGPLGSATAAATNNTYNPTATNNTATPDIVYTLPTNLVFNITYGMAVTNYGGNNGQLTLNRTQ